METPAKGKESAQADPSDTPTQLMPMTPLFRPTDSQSVTVAHTHPMITPIRARMQQMEARLRDLENFAPSALSQQQTEACMQQLAQAFDQLHSLSAQIPQQVARQIYQNIAPIAQQFHQEAGTAQATFTATAQHINQEAENIRAALVASQLAASQAQQAAQFTAQQAQNVQNITFAVPAAPAAPAVPTAPAPIPAYAAPAVAALPLQATAPMEPLLAPMVNPLPFLPATPLPTPDAPAHPSDPRLPPYSGAYDPELWIRQCKAAFAAHNTAEDRKGLWMVTALRDEAASFWLMQCADTVQPSAQNVADKLRARFRPPSFQHNLMARLTTLRMQAGNFSAYADNFLLLTAQISDLSDSVKQAIFLNGLAHNYRVHISLATPANFDDLLELTRRVDTSLRTQPASILHPAFDSAPTAAARFRTNARSSQHTNHRPSSRAPSASGRGPPRSHSRQSRPTTPRRDFPQSTPTNAPSSRGPSRDRPRSASAPRVTCNICGRPGHFARDCYQNTAAPQGRGAANANQSRNGRGNRGNSQRGGRSGRAAPQGNASR